VPLADAPAIRPRKPDGGAPHWHPFALFVAFPRFVASVPTALRYSRMARVYPVISR
jgi:hypothetical protein